jgi:nucleotide-binding universal stress UspA family protein
MFQFKNILYPINLDSNDISPVIKVLEIAKRLNSKIHILYINDPSAGYSHPADHEDAVALRVKEIAPAGLLDSLEIKYAVSKGQLDKEIFTYCKHNNIDLIITGHKHRNKLYSLLFDSPDVNIIDNINLPVLVIPKQ